MTYTSKEFSQRIAEAGFKGESEIGYAVEGKNIRVLTYDILYDICIKYPKQFFGEEYTVKKAGHFPTNYKDISSIIFSMLQQGKSLKEIEDYIEKVSILFNK